eukprot:CAMPEP_0168607460 /NCGR_PEP_ID=MMETSP0449_2-20121227/54_1 /TAXON_ID=1082188 /ORGANISM="Strombidium rassoulzadegani, Strain ras09" /LENGTH=147 /DNA_ID=CAMNT_0008647277 /DNA_START=177 /DNA_END=620 /DNA_ORIENTATION=+
MKAGRVVILLAGRRAGKKAVIVKHFDEGKKGKSFPHALVAGVERNPKKVTKRMSDKKVNRRSKVNAFVKIVNYNHILPTRFTVTGEFAGKEGSELKNIVTEEKLSNKETRLALKKQVRQVFTERYLTPDSSKEKQPAVDFFFKKLRF